AAQLRPAANATAQRQAGGGGATGMAAPTAWRRPPLASATRFGGYLYVGPAVLYLILLSIYPLLYTVQLSTTDVRAGEQFFVGFAHYAALTQDPWFWNSAKVDLIFSVGSTVLHLGLGFAFATLL